MTQEEKIKRLTCDLMSRVNHWNDLKVDYNGKTYSLFGYGAGRVSLLANPFMSNVEEVPLIEEVKPYLRPMKSMTEKEKELYEYLCSTDEEYRQPFDSYHLVDWLNENHFDYRGLISMGLAIEAPKDMYIK